MPPTLPAAKAGLALIALSATAGATLGATPGATAGATPGATPGASPRVAAEDVAPDLVLLQSRPGASLPSRVGVEVGGVSDGDAVVLERLAGEGPGEPVALFAPRDETRPRGYERKWTPAELARAALEHPDVAFASAVPVTAGGGRLLLAPRVIVRLEPPGGREDAARLAASVGLVVERCSSVRRRTWLLVPAGRATGEVVRDAAAGLASRAGVAWAEADSWLEVEPHRLVNDPLFVSGDQWYLDNTGQTGLADIDVNAPEGWDSWFGHPSTAVACIDSGVEATHPDLLPNIWINAGEVPPAAGLVDADGDGVLTFDDLNDPANAGALSDRDGDGRITPLDLVDEDPALVGLENGLDDDGNGYVDDVVGIVYRDGAISHDPYGVAPCDGHGTEVIGMGEARGDDGFGIAGACPRCRILGVGILCGAVPGSALAELFDYAADNGFTSINNSWGPAPGSTIPQVVADAIEAGFEQGRGGRGTTCWFSAGNAHPESVDDNAYAAHPMTFAVGAVDALGRKAFYSQEGQALDFCGLGIGTGTAGTMTTTLGDTHAVVLGATSEANGLAQGVGSLLSSAMPALTPPKLRDVLARTALKVGDPSDYDPATGHGPRFGHGLVRAGAALQLASPGHVLLDRLEYACDQAVVVSVRDAPGLGVRDTLVWSDTEPDGENVQCLEVALRGDLYEGVISLTTAPPDPSDGLLSVRDGDAVRVSFDAPPVVVDTARAACDCDPPTAPTRFVALDLDACAASGVELRWELPTDWGPRGPEALHVHRGEAPDFAVDDASRVQTLPPGATSAIDMPPAPNATWHYAIVAEAAGAGCRGPGGGALSEPLRGQAADELLAPATSPDRVDVRRAGPGWIVSWTGGVADAWDVLRGSLPIRETPGADTACWRPASSAREAFDDAPSPAALHYLVQGRGACGDGGVGTDSEGRPRGIAIPCP